MAQAGTAGRRLAGWRNRTDVPAHILRAHLLQLGHRGVTIYLSFPSSGAVLTDSNRFHWQKKPDGAANSNHSRLIPGGAMNKAQLIQVVHKEIGKEVSKAAAQRALDAVLRSIQRGVKTGGTVQTVGFEAFRLSKRAARLGNIPKTGAQIQIKASKTVRFRAGKALKESLCATYQAKTPVEKNSSSLNFLW
jgi:DNA-binding protein HU-beta